MNRDEKDELESNMVGEVLRVMKKTKLEPNFRAALILEVLETHGFAYTLPAVIPPPEEVDILATNAYFQDRAEGYNKALADITKANPQGLFTKAGDRNEPITK